MEGFIAAILARTAPLLPAPPAPSTASTRATGPGGCLARASPEASAGADGPERAWLLGCIWSIDTTSSLLNPAAQAQFSP
eukprot:CAMPEP_0168455192 /NCGR_PEP_ID=MMETSP0228-20121227/50621_1 /TAXON_ID=133427 /ORGANISM="Protoceratium reticulatum, Strain CCCM 535 (=CCMP 1889)" /LENGTH=79 /DNA_ID=CAMNT_0008470025 /DNA_START=57 /DNA_END=293 /DNA_ORIENTATION=-